MNGPFDRNSSVDATLKFHLKMQPLLVEVVTNESDSLVYVACGQLGKTVSFLVPPPHAKCLLHSLSFNLTSNKLNVNSYFM
jgi:hypothetical protein